MKTVAGCRRPSFFAMAGYIGSADIRCGNRQKRGGTLRYTGSVEIYSGDTHEICVTIRICMFLNSWSRVVLYLSSAEAPYTEGDKRALSCPAANKVFLFTAKLIGIL